MCGIFGILQHQATTAPPLELLQDSAGRLRHRGPDGHGTHADVGVGLAHTRLSLVDLSERSNQPFWDADRRYALVYNGELYDYAELRSDLQRRGVTFRTTSDTEVLLEALIHLGVEATLPRLEGMFAFGLYDAHERTLVLARDRFGIKPLFVHDSDEAFVFASSIDAMRPWLSLRPDVMTVCSFLEGFPGPTSGRSFYEQVSIVPPGAVVRIRRGSRARFAQRLTMSDLVDPAMAADFARRSSADLVDQAESLLLRGVESQLEADVPVGAFCSGGVDSSLIMAMAARSHTDLRVFHADITGPLSERGAAEQLSRHLKLDMQAVAVRDQDFVDTIPDVVHHFGFPFANPTAVPLLMVSQLVHDHNIKAVLCGEGADECFLGYKWLSPDIRQRVRNAPRWLSRKVWRAQPVSGGSPGWDRALVSNLSNSFERELGPVTLGDGDDAARKMPVSRGLASDGNLSYILRSLLLRNDAMGMRASVEARFPILDSRLVRFSVNLPLRYKVRFSPTTLDPDHLFYRDKWIIRQVAARYLPPTLSRRKKGQFPTNAFQRMQVADQFFDTAYIQDLLEVARPRFRYLLANASPMLRLRVMLVEAWLQVCVLGTPKSELSAKLTQHVRVEPLNGRKIAPAS